MHKLIEPGIWGELASALVLLAAVLPLVVRWQWAAARAGRE